MGGTPRVLGLVLADQVQNALEQALHACFSDSAGHQLNALLSGLQGAGDGSLGRRLEGIGIQTHRGLGHAGAEIGRAHV